jgi:hypothetical protein
MNFYPPIFVAHRKLYIVKRLIDWLADWLTDRGSVVGFSLGPYINRNLPSKTVGLGVNQTLNWV